MAKYGQEYLRRLIDAVAAFEKAFDAWMETQVESDHMSARGLFPTVWTRDGEDEVQVRALELAVAEAAGLAATAVDITGALIGVQGVGLIDPISNWSMMRNPKALLSPQDVRTTAATVKGRLASLLADAEAAQTTDLPAFSPALMHSVVWSGAAAHWTSHQYRVAVREAAEGLTVHWKQRLGRNDVDDTPFGRKRSLLATPSRGSPSCGGPVTSTTRRRRACGVDSNRSRSPSATSRPASI